jgi:hypothetical protein
MEKQKLDMNNPQVIDDELWDHYSGLPNPMWYQHITEIEDEEEDTSDSDDTEVTTE